MNWYKESISIAIDNFDDRNLVNKNIRELKGFVEVLTYLTKYVYQNARHAKEAVFNMANDKKMSSFPEIRDLLLDAYKVALDNYDTFAYFTRKSADQLTRQVVVMEEARKEFIEKALPERMKARSQNV